MITILNDQKHLWENCIVSLSPICFHGEGGVYDLYCSQPPGGDQRAHRFTFFETHPNINMQSLSQVFTFTDMT